MTGRNPAESYVHMIITNSYIIVTVDVVAARLKRLPLLN